jgi:hypothetical protein
MNAKIFGLSAENAKILDWLAERGGLELPRLFELEGAKFSAIIAAFLANLCRKLLRRINSMRIRFNSNLSGSHSTFGRDRRLWTD